jgi:hypothetical protein
LVQRATIDKLNAWDPVSLCTVTLAAGQILHGCRIAHLREIGPQAHQVPYVAEFEVDGRMYRCPLSGFQPRTRILEDLEPVPDSAAK